MAGKQVPGDGLSSSLAGMSKNQLYDIMCQMKVKIYPYIPVHVFCVSLVDVLSNSFLLEFFLNFFTDIKSMRVLMSLTDSTEMDLFLLCRH